MDDDKVQGTSDKSVDERLNAFHKPVETAVPEKQPEPTPSSEQKPAEAQAPEVKPDLEKEALENSKNPERTREYIEKLKKERDDSLELSKKPSQDYGSSVFDVFHAPERVQTPQVPEQIPNLNQFQGLNPLQAQNIQQQFIDKDGNVDINGLNRALNEANQRALQAQEESRRTRAELARQAESQQVREAHSTFPQIDPKSKDFNPKFFEAVRDRLVRNMWEGKSQTLLDVAQDIKSFFPDQPVNTAAAEKIAVEKYKEAQQARNQGPFEQGKGQERVEETLDELRAATRRETTKSLSSRALEKRLDAYFKGGK